MVRYHLEALDSDMRTVLKWILKKQEWEFRLDWSGSG